jgi:hypothetical protein
LDISSPYDRLSYFGLRGSEPIAGAPEQFLGDGQIDERRMDATVTEISCQIGETILRIDSFAIPFGHAMDHEGMTIMPRAA